MKKYSIEWKLAQQATNGGWKQGNTWHYIQYGTEYAVPYCGQGIC